MKRYQIICAALLTASLAAQSTAQAQSTTTVYEGFTEPRYDIMLAATEIGRIEEVFVKIGDRVTVGQDIARLEDTLQNSAVKIARLQTQMQGELDAASAEAMLQRASRDQIRKLAEESIARPNELMRAEADVRVAEARYLAATEQEKLRLLELERAELQLARRRVKAPLAGVISKIYHHPGEYVTPADPAVVRLLVIDQLFAVFNVPADEVAALSVGSPVRVYLRGSAQTANGQIHMIAPDIDGESGTVQVKVSLDNSSGELRAGDRCTMQVAPRRQAARPHNSDDENVEAKQVR